MLLGIADLIFFAFSKSSTKAVYKNLLHLILNLVVFPFVLIVIFFAIALVLVFSSPLK